MVGADPEVFKTVEPVIDCWAGTIAHLGPVGAGHKMKLIMNFISTSYAAVYSEAFTLAAKVGLSPQTVQQVIAPSRMGCGFFDTYTGWAVGRDPNAHKFAIENAAKDIGYVCLMAQDAGVVNPMSATVRNAYAAAVASGKGADYMPMLADFIAAQNGVDLAQVVKDGEA